MSKYRKQIFKTYSFSEFQDFLLKFEPHEIFDVKFTVLTNGNNEDIMYSCVYLKIIEDDKTDV